MTISRIEFDQFVAESETIMAANTMESYRSSVDSFIRFVGSKPVTPKVVDEWSNKQLADGVRRDTVGKYRRGVKAFIEWKIRNGSWDKPNPVYSWKNVRSMAPPREAFTEEDYRNILACPAVVGTWWAPLVVLAWHTGLRMGDIAMMEWKDVDMVRRSIKVVPIKTKRFGKVVEIPFGDEVWGVLNSQERTTRYVIPSAAVDYKNDRHKTISAEFCRVLKKAGITGKSFHCFRHAFVTRHLNAGTNPAVIAAVTGHGLSSLMNYAHVSLDAKRTALKI